MGNFITSQRDESSICSSRRTLLRIAATGMIAAGAAALIAVGGAAAKPVGTAASQIGKPIMPIARATATPVLRTLQQIQQFQAEHPSLGLHQTAHAPLIPMGEKAYQKAKREAANAAPGLKPIINAQPPAANAPHVIVNGTNHGPAESDPGNANYPPDSNGAISGSQIVAPVNLTYNVYARNSSPPFKNVLSVSFGALLGTTNALSDPRVIYDRIWQRWVITLIDVTASASDPTCFWTVISKGPNAAGPFWTYHLCLGSGNFTGGIWDYDMQGMSQDAVFVTGNWFGPAPSFSTYYGAVLAALPKAELYNGLGFQYLTYAIGNPSASGTVAPPIVGDSNANAFFLAVDNDGSHLDLYKGTNLSNQTQFSLSLQAQISATIGGVPPSARQPGTSAVLDSLDGRFQAPSAQWGDSLWNTRATNLTGFPAPIFYELSTSGNSVLQSGYFFESGSSDDWNPSIGVNGEGDAFVSWSSTDATSTNSSVRHFPRVRFSGRLAGDDADVIGAGASLYNSPVALTGNTQGSVQRWGDYSSAFIDPFSPLCRAGIFNEGVKDANTWQVHFGVVGFC
jgi:hypothetical protein